MKKEERAFFFSSSFSFSAQKTLLRYDIYCQFVSRMPTPFAYIDYGLMVLDALLPEWKMSRNEIWTALGMGGRGLLANIRTSNKVCAVKHSEHCGPISKHLFISFVSFSLLGGMNFLSNEIRI